MPAVRITVADETITDNPTAQDLTDPLPLTLTFRDTNASRRSPTCPDPLTMDSYENGSCLAFG